MHRFFIVSILAIAVVSAGCSGDGAVVVSDSTVPPPPVTSITEPSTTTSTAPTTTTTTAPQPPTLATDPIQGATVDSYLISIEIASDPGVTLTIGDSDLPVDSTGAASVSVLNSPGENNVDIVATNETGLSTTSSLTYSYEPVSGWAIAIGDSVMLGTKPEIEKRVPGVTVDATVSRQFSAVPSMIRSMVEGPTPPELIIIGLGSNGPARDSDFDAVMEAAVDVPLVAFVNVRVPRTWEDTSNRVIAEGVARYENAVLVDWYSASIDRPELFAGDGVHPKQPGRVILAELIAEAVFPLGPPPLPTEDE